MKGLVPTSQNMHIGTVCILYVYCIHTEIWYMLKFHSSIQDMNVHKLTNASVESPGFISEQPVNCITLDIICCATLLVPIVSIITN